MGKLDVWFKKSDKWFKSLEQEKPTQQQWLEALQAQVGDIRVLARRYNAVWILFAAFLAIIGLSIIPGHFNRFDIMWVGIASLTLCHVAIAVSVVLLNTAWGRHSVEAVVWGFFALVPLFGLFVASRVFLDVYRGLERSGFRPVWYGCYTNLEIERVLNQTVCTNCTYDLTGNESGRCPECGEALSHEPE